jgi:hypothetical protein
MNDDTFLRHLAVRGADLSRWPAGSQVAAAARLAASPALRAAWEDELALDRRLVGQGGGGRAMAVDDQRVGRLVAVVVARAAQAASPPGDEPMAMLVGRMPVRLAGALCASLLLLGWLAGSALPPGAGPPPVSDDLVALLSDAPMALEGDAR